MTIPYRDDLAYIHDVGHGEFARRAVPGLLKVLREGKVTSGLVIDLGCGSGIWTEQLLAAGFDAQGIDISPAMIQLAQQRAPQANFRCESFLRAKLPTCAAVTSIGECVNYLFDRQHKPAAALAKMFGRIHRALQPGGHLIFDFLTPQLLLRGDPPRRFREGDDWAVLVEVETNTRRQQLTRHITSFRQVGKLFRRDRESHLVQLLDERKLAAQLHSLGFRVVRLAGYGDMKFAAGHVGLLAVKDKL
ncbi:MAG: class I SAM-dependent methyltransferase [Pirellulales bacterium]|nr:class I SAM-dependent methyltransferase [Pirellulales bacterium]